MADPFRVTFNGKQFVIVSDDYQTWYLDAGDDEDEADKLCEAMTKGYEIAMKQSENNPQNK